MCTYFKFAFRVWANTHICSYIHHGISTSVSPLLDIHFHFQAFAVMNKALYRLSWTNLFLDMCFISLKYLLVKTIGSMVNICLALETMLGHFRKWLHHFIFLQAIDGSPNAPHPCQYTCDVEHVLQCLQIFAHCFMGLSSYCILTAFIKYILNIIFCHIVSEGFRIVTVLSLDMFIYFVAYFRCVSL